MNCQICGRISEPGAKFCADCRSARKRAFDATVTQPLLFAAGTGRSRGRLLRPSQSAAAKARRAAEKALHAAPPPVESVAAVPRRRNVIVVVTGLVAVALIGAYLVREIHRTQRAHMPQAVEQPVPSGSEGVAPTVSVVPANLAPKAVSETPSPDRLMAMPESEPGPHPKLEPAKRTNAKQRSLPAEPMGPPIELAAPPPAIAAAPAPAPVPAAREAPRPDPVQVFQDSLARCASGNLIDRILCDQRVRREYCDGRWGQVPQCQSGVANDHGQ